MPDFGTWESKQGWDATNSNQHPFPWRCTRELFQRPVSPFAPHWRWVAAQFGGILLLILLGWLDAPARQARVAGGAERCWCPSCCWPLALALQAGTMRRLADDDGKRVQAGVGRADAAGVGRLACAVWALLDWCDDRIPLWAGYLNSRASASARASSSPTSTCSAGSWFSNGFCAGWWCRPRSFPTHLSRRNGAGGCPGGGCCASCGTGAGG